jgi:hypothetical protein
MEGQVVFNFITKLFDLIVEINGQKETISTSKNFGHWQYHLNRGTLSKAVAKYGITRFVYVGFTPNEPPPSNEPLPAPQPLVHPDTPTAWFCTQSLFDTVVKNRGRPRKYLPKVAGVTVHKMSDSEPTPFRSVSIKERGDIERHFKVFKRTMSNNEALSEIAQKFHVPYKQAYQIVLELL